MDEELKQTDAGVAASPPALTGEPANSDEVTAHRAAPPIPDGWVAKPRPIESAPADGTPFLAWYLKLKLGKGGNPTNEVVGGAWAICRKGVEWDESDWIGAHGAHFSEDWCFAERPTSWIPLPPPLASALSPTGVAPTTTGSQK